MVSSAEPLPPSAVAMKSRFSCRQIRLQEVFIARQYNVSLSFYCSPENRTVVFIADGLFLQNWCIRYTDKLQRLQNQAQEFLHIRYSLRKFTIKDASYLVDILLTNYALIRISDSLNISLERRAMPQHG